MRQTARQKAKQKVLHIIKELESELYVEASKNEADFDYYRLSLQTRMLREAMRRLEDHL